jgi:hypothetical protein
MASGDERLAEMIREHQRLNGEWEKAKEKLRARGDRTLLVPVEFLERLEEAAAARPQLGAVNTSALRG